MDTPLAEVKKALIPLQHHREETGFGERAAAKGLPLDTRTPPHPTPTAHIPTRRRERDRETEGNQRENSLKVSALSLDL